MVIQVVQTVNLAERTSSKRVTLRLDIEMKPEMFLITISSSFQVTGVGRRWRGRMNSGMLRPFIRR